MALTESKNLDIWMVAPDFTLPDTLSGNNVSLEEAKWEKATVIMFICNHCPFVLHINKQVVKIANDYKDKWVNFIAISSNDVLTHPQDGPKLMTKHAQETWYTFPYLYDETQEIAKSYSAVCTPDIYVFDSQLQLFYHWQIDDSRPGNEVSCDGSDLRNALDLIIQSWKILPEQKPSIGCNIKWK